MRKAGGCLHTAIFRMSGLLLRSNMGQMFGTVCKAYEAKHSPYQSKMRPTYSSITEAKRQLPFWGWFCVDSAAYSATLEHWYKKECLCSEALKNKYL